MSPTRCVRSPRRSISVYLRAGLLLLLAATACGMQGGGCDPVIIDVPPVIVESDHILGSPDAALTVVEFYGLYCPACAAFERNEFNTLRQAYIETGLVRWVFRHYINMGSSDFLLAAEATECAADQGRYFEFRHLVMANQSAHGEAAMQAHASTLGLDRPVFDACLASDAKRSRVQQDVDSAIALGIPSTPTFVVGAERVRGYRTAAQLSEIIERHLTGEAP